jgi:hypothetical protein
MTSYEAWRAGRWGWWDPSAPGYLSAKTLASLARGIADVKAGRVTEMFIRRWSDSFSGGMGVVPDQRTGPANRRVRPWEHGDGGYTLRTGFLSGQDLGATRHGNHGRRSTDAPPARSQVIRAATDRRCSYRTPWLERRSSGVGFVRIATSADRFAARFDAELQRRGMFIPNVEDLDDLLERALPIVGDPFLDARASRARARVTEIFVALRAWAP